MKLADEYAVLSRHSMLFLIAIFAFTSKAVLESSLPLIRIVVTGAVIVAFASFIAGYSTLLDLYAQERDSPSTSERTPPAPATVTKAQCQYVLTMIALFLQAVALLLVLWARPGP